MTKKDGDRLRAMMAELRTMAADYGVTNEGTGRALFYLSNEVELTLKGLRDRPRLTHSSPKK